MREAKHKDYSKRDKQLIGYQLQEFHSVDEIYFYMESLFQDGMDEHHISLALDIFIRDAAFFEEADLENETFQLFVRELGRNMILFQKEKNYAKAAQFMDWFCIEDKYLWVNLE